MLSAIKKFQLQNSTFQLILFASFLLLILLPLLQKGTFIDGMLYKTVAYNYSINQATFWNMKFTNTSMTFFCEQPPFYFFLLGGFYKIFGSHFLIDRIFTLLLSIGLAFVLWQIIKKSITTNKSNSFFLVIFFLLSIPVLCWSYANQVIEPLVCLLVATSIYFFIAYIKKQYILYIFLFGTTTFLLFLTKGFQSCFVISLPFFYLFVTRFKKVFFVFNLINVITFIVLTGLTIFMYKPGINWFNCYYQSRLVQTMQNVGNTTNSHLEIIIRFFTELIICICFIVILSIWLIIKKKYSFKLLFKNFISNKLALSLLLTSLLGSMPYAISLVQRGFYLVPSFICFVLAIVIGLNKYWQFLYFGLKAISRKKIVQYISLVIFIGSTTIAIININSYKRDKDLLNDVAQIKLHINKADTVLIKGDLWNYFSLHAYLYMDKHTSLSSEVKNPRFLLIKKDNTDEEIKELYIKINLSTTELDLYKHK